MRYLAATLCVLLGLLLLPSGVFAAAPEFNSFITNQAEVKYVNSTTQLFESFTTNQARFKVGQFYGLTLVKDTSINGGAGNTYYLSHTLTNTGNVTDNFKLSSKGLGVITDSQTLIVKDINGNGQDDDSEPTITETGNMRPGDSVQLLLAISVPADRSIGDDIRGQIIATSSFDASATVTNTDTINLVAGATFRVIKSALPLCETKMSPGAMITYNLSIKNTSNEIVTGHSYTLDQVDASGNYSSGAQITRSGVVLEDAIPANTEYVAGSIQNVAPVSAIPVMQHPADVGTTTWRHIDSWNGVNTGATRLAKLGLFLAPNNITPNQTARMQFKAKIVADVTPGTTITNTASIDLDLDGTADFKSAEVCNKVNPSNDASGNTNAAVIRFLTPTTTIKKSGGAADFYSDDNFEDAQLYKVNNGKGDYDVKKQGIFIQVDSTSLNSTSYNSDNIAGDSDHLDSDGQPVIVHLESKITGDKLQVVMLETGPNSGVFRSIRPIILDDSDPIDDPLCPASGDKTSPHMDGTDISGCNMRSSSGDQLIASVFDPGIGTVITDAAVVDPLGVVFDTTTNQPVTGAVVSLLCAGQTVLGTNPAGSTAQTNLALGLGCAEDGAAPDPFSAGTLASQTTAADGFYQYDTIFPGNYYINVVPPAGYSISTLPSNHASFATREVNQFSYGKNGYTNTANLGVFNMAAGDPILTIDIPLDPDPAVNGDLVLAKSVNTTVAEIGGWVKYTLTLNNQSGATQNSVVIRDTLPHGFKYVSGTTKLDGAVAADPTGAPGSDLTFSIGTMADGSSNTFTYIVKLTAGAMDSNGINVAQASSATSISNVARAQVKIQRTGVLTDDAILFGKIYIDADCKEDLQQANDTPIGGVKVYMENGTFAVTDQDGMYSIYGLSPGRHVVKVDKYTLPADVKLMQTGPWEGEGDSSRFVDLMGGDFHRADFIADCPADAASVIENISARNNKLDKGNNVFKQADDYRADGQYNYNQNILDPSQGMAGQTNAAAAQGVIDKANMSKARGFAVRLVTTDSLEKAEQAMAGLPAELQAKAYIYSDGANHNVHSGYEVSEDLLTDLVSLIKDEGLGVEIVPADFSKIATVKGSVEIERMPITEERAKTITRAEGKAGTWLWPKGEFSWKGRFMVAVRGGIKNVDLFVNDEKVSKAKLGEQILNKREGTQLLAWYGVSLKPGVNKLEVKAMDPFGNLRVMASKEFKHPGVVERMTLEAMSDELAADGGNSSVPIKIKMLDKNGYPAQGIWFVTLKTTDGQFKEADIQTNTPGYQAKVVNGEATLNLLSSSKTGTVTIKAANGNYEAETQVVQVPALRPLVATGLVDLHLSKSKNDSTNSSIEYPEGLSGGEEFDGRSAVFMKGRVKGNLHLTLSYDTDKTDEDLLRDINPGKSYPLHGDASVRGFEARSRSKLFLKLEKNRNSIMWGDFNTTANHINAGLAKTSRTLTGVNAIVDKGKFRAQVYAANLQDQRAQEEFRGNGTALLYELGGAPIVLHSEVLTKVVRDRDNIGLEISSEPLERFKDYTIDELSGRISFHETIPAFDDDNNPVYIRATYDQQKNGTDYLVGGAAAEYDVTEKVKAGVSTIVDDHQTDGSRVSGVTLSYDDKAAVTASVELAHMKHNNTTSSGSAARMNANYKWENGSNTQLAYNRAETGFTHSEGGVSADRKEFRLGHKQKIDQSMNINLDLISSSALTTDQGRKSLSLTMDKKIMGWKLTAGLRRVEQHNELDDETFDNVVLGAGRAFELFGKSGRVDAEMEHDTSASRARYTVGTKLKWSELSDLYARYELIDSTSGITSLSTSSKKHSLTFGINKRWSESTQTFSEYRLRSAIDAYDFESSSGVKGTYELEPGLSISPKFEMINTLQGSGTADAVALSTGISDTRDKDSRKTLHLETRHTTASRHYGVRGSYAARLEEDWSAMVKDELSVLDESKKSLRLKHTLTLGLARRPKLDNQYHKLYMYQLKQDYDPDADLREAVHLLSTHQNYKFNTDLTMAFRLGGKYQRTKIDGFKLNSTAVVADTRLLWDITKRWQMDLRGGVLKTSGDGARKSAGLGFSYLVDKDLRVGFGYNFVGFRDEDLDPRGFNAKGIYLNLQYKFDEDDLQWLSRQ